MKGLSVKENILEILYENRVYSFMLYSGLLRGQSMELHS